MADWQIGDMALCVRSGVMKCPKDEFVTHTGQNVKGAAFKTVCGISIDPMSKVSDCACVVLRFTDGSAGIAARFRKITPPEADAFDREVIEHMTRQPVEAA